MPDSQGLLTQQERDAIAAAMKNKLKATACPWCGQDRWEIGPSLVIQPPLLGDGRMSVVGPLVPLVSLISPCGYVAQFAAKMFGLQQRAATPAGTPTPAPEAG